MQMNLPEMVRILTALLTHGMSNKSDKKSRGTEGPPVISNCYC